MDQLHARYPFLREAKAAVQRADIDLPSLVDDDPSPTIERGLERVRSAIADGRISAPVADTRVEVLSYPVARVLVSLVDDPVLIDRYALAEARRAFEYLERELGAGPDLRSVSRTEWSLDEFLEEFGFEEAIHSTEDTYEIEVTAYLSLSTALRDPRWRLVSRDLSTGTLPISRGELETLLQEAIRLRVAEDLPLDVPEPVASALEDEVATIEDSLASVSIPTDLQAVEPELFPRCMRGIYDRAAGEQPVSAVERFVLIAFLAGIGADPEEIVRTFSPPDNETRRRIEYQVEQLHGETRSTAYPPPSCETLASMEICPRDDACREHGHPLATYAVRLAATR